MIDRNLTAGQCVHVGMKRMTEVAFAKNFLSFSRYILIGCPATSPAEERPEDLTLMQYG